MKDTQISFRLGDPAARVPEVKRLVMSAEQPPKVDREQGMKKIEQLIREYRNFAASHDEAAINEERVKIAFIVPLFEALGWNMRTDEVLPEQRTLAGEADFGLRVYGATPQVYVECKPFRESLDGYRVERGRQVSYAEKAIQYAWSMKANWAILTNFKKLRLYYTLVKKPSEGLVFPEISFEEYASKFDELWLLSKDSIASGAIETYRKKATRNYVDEEFLRDLIECRQLLLDNIRGNNPTLPPDDVNESAQRILDRIIFVRCCEDRGIVPAEMLWKHYQHWQEVAIDKTVRTFMMDLKNMFRDIDQVYNGKLFEPHLCEDLRIDNSVFQDMLERLYGDGARTGYRFDAVPINVLGQAYELYIGSVIVEKTGVAKGVEIVEDYKKRQEHGIYYTPAFVTHFIVRQTLGEILKKARTGDDVLRLKLLDQAAGSGSFLIEAFDQFREAYRAYKMSYEQEMLKAPLAVRLAQPEWIEPEKAILQNNVYGVDLDSQAVEIATLNLELKAVKAKGRIPYLGEHVKRGNSIVSHTADELLQKLGETEIKELLGKDWRSEWQHKHPFNYHEAFKEIMQTGGFDVIVGNPPYNNMRDPELKVEQAYCKRYHEDIFRGNSDLLFYFIENGLSVLKQGGVLGLIVARYFMKSEQADLLRKYILAHSRIRYIVDTRNVQVFGRVNVLTCIVVLERDDSPAEAKSNHRIKVVNVKDAFKGTLEQLFEWIDRHIEEAERSDDWIEVFQVEQGRLSDEPWTLEPPAVERLLNKIDRDCWQLESPETCQVGVGYDTELNEARLDREVEREDAPKHGVFIITERESEELELEKDLLAKMVKAFQIQRYALLDQGYLLLNTNAETDIDRYPNAKKHLTRFRRQLEERDAMPRCGWFGIGLPKNRELFEANATKILVPKYATGNKFAYDDGNGYVHNGQE
jgi:type I restriction-modification system DNA methylase subunit